MTNNSKIIENTIFIVLLLFYNALSSMFLYLPPLFGVLFLYFHRIIEAERYYSLLFFTLALFICESSEGYYPGILFIVYTIVYVFLSSKVRKTFKHFDALEFFYVPVIYLLYILFNDFLIFIVGKEVNIVIPLLFLYVFFESFLMLVIKWILDIK